jgi:Cd2+/Zn2+-exporting ATPase
VAVEKVGIGSRVRVRPGERIPCDGLVMEGGSDVNQAMITGESVPVWKGAGDEVFAGTVNGDGLLEMETTRLARDTTLARIARVVERAQHQRAPAEHFVEKFARIYTPVVLMLALLVAVVPPLAAAGDWGYWFYQGMVILLISCPCALVISTPVTIVAALTSAARSGVLVKGGAYLEEAARLRAIAFDKTGVLTAGHPEVSQVVPLGGHTREEVLERLAAVEQGSRHPLAGAIVRYAASQGIRPAAAAAFQTVRGKGAEAQVAGERYWAGSLRLLEEKGLANDTLREQIRELAASGGMTVAFGSEREPWALLSLADPVRPEAAAVTRELAGLKLDDIVILTGDHPVAAKVIAGQAGIGAIHADMLPADKAEAIDGLRARHGHVGMVGDGINDAQAMSHASLGIALGHASVDAVIETADVVLLSGGLTKLPDLVRLGRRTVAIIRENIVIALALKGIFFGLAVFGLATLWMAVAADMGATLLVIFNGLRMLDQAPRV